MRHRDNRRDAGLRDEEHGIREPLRQGPTYLAVDLGILKGIRSDECENLLNGLDELDAETFALSFVPLEAVCQIRLRLWPNQKAPSHPRPRRRAFTSGHGDPSDGLR